MLKRITDNDALVKAMQEDAMYDVADDEVTPEIDEIRESVKAPAAPPKVPKTFLSNDCVFNCAYCGCRSGNECRERYRTEPRALAELSLKQSGDTGVFLTSAIVKNANYTQELIAETVRIMRQDLGYGGYIHAKVMPGADPLLIRETGMLANRLSVNIEVAKSEGYQLIAKNKNKQNILTPMKQISDLIAQTRAEGIPFARSQTTQLMAGSTGEDDYTILRLSGALYQRYRLKRVYYTAYQLTHQPIGYDLMSPVRTPHWRMARLYQADRLMQLYGFTAEEIVPDETPFLSEELDPKAAWALRNLHLFPIEVNTAEFEELLRIPGIGTTYAARILKARRRYSITHEILRKLGVQLKKSRHFITCGGIFDGYGGSDVETLKAYLASARRQVALFF